MANFTIYNDLKIYWLGHAGFKLVWQEKIVYIDPYQVSQQPRGDYIFITHSHPDHLDQQSIFSLSKPETLILTTEEAAPKIYGNTKAVRALDREKLADGVEYLALPAYNLGKPYHPKGLGLGFFIKMGRTSVYHAGDTDRIPEMLRIASRVQVALLPIGGAFTMDAVEASKAAKDLKPKVVIPMHYGKLPQTHGEPTKFSSLLERVCEVRILVSA